MDDPVKKINDEETLSIKPPKVIVGDHPVEHGKYLIDTLEINNLKEEVLNWINKRVPGGLVYGNPRLGKSYAIDYLIREEDNSFHVFRFNCQRFIRPNENNFFEFLLRDLKHALYQKGKANAKRDRLYKFLLERGESVQRKQILLFVDYAQRLNEIEYDWLMDIFNELDRYGITLTTVLVGQENLKFLRTTFAESDMKQIVGRFMIDQYKFHGITDIDSLCYLLAGYDYAAEYPENSGWSYTRFFFPIGFSFGERLESFAEPLWELFININKNAGYNKFIEVPMYYIIATINFLFSKYGINGESLEWINLNHWKESIKQSGYYIYQGINYDDE